MALLLPTEKSHLPRPWHLVGVAGLMIAALILTFHRVGSKGLSAELSALIPRGGDLFWQAMGFLTPLVLGIIAIGVIVLRFGPANLALTGKVITPSPSATP